MYHRWFLAIKKVELYILVIRNSHYLLAWKKYIELNKLIMFFFYYWPIVVIIRTVNKRTSEQQRATEYCWITTVQASSFMHDVKIRVMSLMFINYILFVH